MNGEVDQLRPRFMVRFWYRLLAGQNSSMLHIFTCPYDIQMDDQYLHTSFNNALLLNEHVTQSKFYNALFWLAHYCLHLDEIATHASFITLAHSPLQVLFMHLCLKEISIGVYRKAHKIVKYLKLKRMNLSIEHRELMLALIKFKIEALLR